MYWHDLNKLFAFVGRMWGQNMKTTTSQKWHHNEPKRPDKLVHRHVLLVSYFVWNGKLFAGNYSRNRSQGLHPCSTSSKRNPCASYKFEQYVPHDGIFVLLKQNRQKYHHSNQNLKLCLNVFLGFFTQCSADYLRPFRISEIWHVKFF